jgi:hypothetical protein
VSYISSDQIKHVNLHACAFVAPVCKQVANDDLVDARRTESRGMGAKNTPRSRA